MSRFQNRLRDGQLIGEATRYESRRLGERIDCPQGNDRCSSRAATEPHGNLSDDSGSTWAARHRTGFGQEETMALSRRRTEIGVEANIRVRTHVAYWQHRPESGARFPHLKSLSCAGPNSNCEKLAIVGATGKWTANMFWLASY